MSHSHRFPSEVVQAHPVLLVPAFFGAVGTGAFVSPQAARVAFIMAVGAALSVEACCRVLIKRAWGRESSPPVEGDPVALVPVMAALLWTRGASVLLRWVNDSYATGLRVGIAASVAVTVIQLAAWLAAATGVVRSSRLVIPAGSSTR